MSRRSAAAGGQGGALGPRIVVEEALLDVQPTLDHGVELRIRGDKRAELNSAFTEFSFWGSQMAADCLGMRASKPGRSS